VSSIWEIPFIVVDVETSGSNSIENRVMEIACVTTIGGEITNVFSSLINPHERIPPFIANMTGITDTMTNNAPEAHDVIPRVEEIFNQKDAIFVAHNARFDWSFVVESFNLAGLPKPQIPRLCTLKFARRLLPKAIKKNLGDLATYFNITIKDRHRATGDAVATAHILNEMLEIAEQEHDIKNIYDLLKFQNKTIRNFRAPAYQIKKFEQSLEQLPETPGVFQFQDSNKNTLYIGRAASLKEKVNLFFNNEIMLSKKLGIMIRNAEFLQWYENDSNISAILFEAKLINKYNPPYNTAEKIFRNYPYIKLTVDDSFPYVEICFKIEDNKNEYYGPFKNVAVAHQIIKLIENKTKIRKCNINLQKGEKIESCYFYRTGKCAAPCENIISKDDYIQEVNAARAILNNYADDPVNKLEQQLDLLAASVEKTKIDSLRTEINLLRNKPQYLLLKNNRNNDAVLINPVSEREKIIELIIIKQGEFIHSELIGKRSNLQHVLKIISKEFYSNGSDSSKENHSDSRTLRTINLYLNKNKDYGKLIYKTDKTEAEFINEIISQIHNIKYKQST